MGDVHRAFDTLLRRDVAIKVLHTGVGKAGGDAGARLLREARLGAALTHPNIVTIHDMGQEDDGDAFIVMELALGQTLRAIMRTSATLIDTTKKLQWLFEIASALEAAHDAGLIHRDIKPENVIITPNGKVKVLDFGIAKVQGGEPVSGSMAAAPPSLGIVGTPAYMAPEQWHGDVDERADQYAWGILAYELLSGHRPVVVLPGQPARRETLRSLIEFGLPPELDVIVARATSRKPSDRFQSMRTLLAAWPRPSDPMLDAGAPPTKIERATNLAKLGSGEAAPTLAMTVASTEVMPGAPPRPDAGQLAAMERSDADPLATMESASVSHTANSPPPRVRAKPRRWSKGAAAALVVAGAALVVVAVRARRDPSTPAQTATKAGSAGAPLLAMAGDQGMVRVGASGSCALMPDRTLSCWGGGRATPAAIEGLAGVFEFSLGATHACAVATSGSDRTRGDVYCWGNNDKGQLGDGTTTPSAVAKKVLLPRRMSLVASSSTHTCAVGARDAPDLYCWGGNEMGQLGDGTTTPSLVPKRVAFDAGAQVLRFSIGQELGCALLRPGNQLWCWGRNDVGQAGQDPARMPSVNRPAVVSGLPAVNGIFPGVRHVCARDAASREVWCWGANDRGQIGLGTVSAWERPSHVPGIAAIDTMRAGADFSCALLANIGMPVRGRCWGSNDFGQLGTEPIGKDQPSPVENASIDSGFDAKMSSHGCKSDAATGAVSCWGRNDEHQLGDGTGRSSAVPVRVHY